MRIFKYVCSGVVGVSVNIGTLWLLADRLEVYYLAASILAVSLSTVVGFLLQKFWTFEERSMRRAAGQFGLYVSVALFNIALNTVIVYGLVDGLGTHHLFAQFIGAGVVAVGSFLLYRHIIFKAPLVAQE